MLPKRLAYPVLTVLVLTAAALACGPQTPLPPPSTPTAIAAPLLSAPDHPLPTETPLAGEQPTQPPAPLAGELSATGPWLVFPTQEGIWAANADGSAVVSLVSGVKLAAPLAIAPGGGHVAYITSTGTGYDGLTLHLLSLPSGQTSVITPLTSPSTEPGPNAEPGSGPLEAVRAIVDVPSLAWSPDGGRLAFIGVMDGPSADLYTYTLSDGSIKRLTDGPSQGFQPTWSPDGQYIVHAGADTFGTGAGYGMAGVWAAAADGSQVISLYTPGPDSFDEVFVGWTGPRAIMVYSWNPGYYGSHNLRIVDFESNTTQVIWQGAFAESDLAFDPVSDTVMIGVDEFSAENGTASGQPIQAGLYVANLGALGSAHVSDVVAADLVWEPSLARFLGRTDQGAVQVSIDGILSALPAPVAGVPLLSPDGASWLWSSDGYSGQPGLWIGSVGVTPAQVFQGAVYYATWSPDGQRVFFFTEEGLYLTDRSGSTPTLIGAGAFLSTNEGVGWAAP